MKSWTKIPNNLASKLSSSDTYRFTALSFTPRKAGYTDSTFKQIGEYINANNPESESTVQKFIHRLKDANYIRIDELWLDGKRRNKYYFENIDTKFLLIKKELLELKINIELKGFMIQLFSLTINNTFDCNYSLNKIVSLIKVSKPTAQKYLSELTEKGYILKTTSGYRLSSEYFSIGNKKEKQVIEIFKNLQGCEHLTNRFYKTDWNTIIAPAKYWLAVEGGCAGMKRDKKIEIEIIL